MLRGRRDLRVHEQSLQCSRKRAEARMMVKCLRQFAVALITEELAVSSMGGNQREEEAWGYPSGAPMNSRPSVLS